MANTVNQHRLAKLREYENRLATMQQATKVHVMLLCTESWIEMCS
jgi:hypothetical protein